MIPGVAGSSPVVRPFTFPFLFAKVQIIPPIFIEVRWNMSDRPKNIMHPEIKGLLTLAFSLFLFLSHISFIHEMPNHNWIGLCGYYSALGCLYLLGMGSYLLIFYLGWIGWLFLTGEKLPNLKLKTGYLLLLIFSFCILLNLIAETQKFSSPFFEKRVFSEIYVRSYPSPYRSYRFNLGGVPLYYLYRDLPTFNLSHLLSNTGVLITFSISALFSFILLTNIRLIPFFKKLESFGTNAFKLLIKIAKDLKFSYKPIEKPPSSDLLEKSLRNVETPSASFENRESQDSLQVKTLLDQKKSPSPKPSSNRSYPYRGEFKRYRFPPISLLSDAKKVDQPTLKRDLKQQASILKETLKSFGVDAHIGQINCGPTITSFEVHPPVGVKVQKIKVLSNDIALNLQAKSIRIIAPIPGKAAVGIEVPSPYPQEVGFKEMLLEYQRGKKLHIPIFLGQTVTGEDIVCDLTKMPHCIIAGATGSGKSVCINSIVMSILMTARPDEIGLLLIDPKKVELSSYTNLPHMIAPVITEAHGAAAALGWLVKEMKHRYEILKLLGLRHIHAFNHRRIRPQKEAETLIDIPIKMGYIVTIIDEFADLIMASTSDLETPITRIAQMARAVGIHLILATQRPSREVLTGLIKANFPTCIAFKVASRINSQIIVGENGAETLLGNGDLLFLPPGTSQLIRAQGVFVRDQDINQVITFIENQAPTNYLIKSFDHMNVDDSFDGDKKPKDHLYEEAFSIVTKTGVASTTFLQRKLKIGYARAASLVDELELRGVIGPQDGSRPRSVLLKSDQKNNQA